MVSIDKSLCTGCGQCAANCAVHALVREEDGTYRCNKMFCFRCGQCVALCPTGAASMPDLEAPVEYEPEKFDLDPAVLLNAMRFRRSVRRFTGEKVTREELDRLLEAGRCAPTSSNTQSVRFTVLDREFEALRPQIWESFADWARRENRKLLLRRYESYRAAPDQPDTLFYGANQLLVVTSRYQIDGCLALANIELMAHAMGLGALYCGFASWAISAAPALREYFGITDRQQLCGCLILGRTNLKFRRTAPRNPANVEWR